MRDKRIFPRFDLNVKGSYNLPAKFDSAYNVTMVNLSLGGFCFTANEVLGEGTFVNLKVELEKNQMIELSVKVVWCRRTEAPGKFQVGVSINNTACKDYEKLMAFCKRQLPSKS